MREQIRTSVMHPITQEGRATGLVELATEVYVEPTAAARTEIHALATVIGRVKRLDSPPGGLYAGLAVFVLAVLGLQIFSENSDLKGLVIGGGLSVGK